MIGSLAWRALMRRNLIYLRRNWISTILEIALPVVFFSFLVLIKGATDDGDLAAKTVEAIIPTDDFAYRILSFRDYVTALQAPRVCVPSVRGGFDISGIPWIQGIGYPKGIGYNWQVPLVKCDSLKCEEEGQDAQPFCEYFGIAVAGENGGAERAANFADWLYNKYPILSETENLPFDFDFVRILDSSQAMDDLVKAKEYADSNKIAMGIVFDGNDPNAYKYSLRQNSTNYNSPEAEGRPATLTTPDTAKLLESFAKNDFDSCQPLDGTAEQGPLQNSCTGQYVYNGVLTFQRLVGDYILEASGAADLGYKVAENGVTFVQFPARSYLESGFFGDIAETGPLLIVLGLLYPIASMIGYIAKEKELRQKELMKMMSVTESDIGWAWFITFSSIHILTAIFMTAVSISLYENSDGIYLLIYWIVTMINFVLFSMTLAAFTSKATRAVLIGILVFFAGIFISISLDYEEQSASLTSLLSRHPVAAFAFGLQEIGRLEDKGIGLTSNSIDTTDSVSGWAFNDTLSALFSNLVLWGFLTWYLNRVVPLDYGQAEPIWFPIKRCIDCFRKKEDFEDAFTEEESYPDGIPFEQVPETLRKQADKNVLIRNLRKQFGEKTAVDDLNLSMYSGQITALLGHNGAGKTTTIGMISGAFKPTSGTARVAGKDILRDMSAIRKEMGICLQHDCLFPRLTVREHLQFFSRVKGLYSKKSKAEADEQIDQEIKDVALFEKRNTFSSNLSGGMKRKLSLAIAFCGDSKVVLLDEPTSGMDPFSRRFTWNVIRSYRENRCIILTTHFMDEADILGDRIAIMAEGQLRCYGSSLFLKKTYGVGYQLIIEKLGGNSEHGKNVSDRMHANDDTLKEIVQTAVPEAKMLSNVGTELSYQLPLAASSKFGPMFDGLDKEIEEKRISSYGVGITTLDEVFLLVARGDSHDKTERYASSTHMQALSEKRMREDGERSARSKMDLNKSNLFGTHLGALLRKRAANFKRDKKAWCCTTIFPSIFVMLGLIIFTFGAVKRDLDPLTLTLDDYNTKISESPRNPVTVNADGVFNCQPGRCAYQTEALNGTSYFLCGQEVELPQGTVCSISTAESVLSTLEGKDGLSLTAIEAKNISETSQGLFDFLDDFRASQYGAVFFTHESGSTLEDGSLYSDTVIDLCSQNTGDYRTTKECEGYDGYGYVVQYNFTALHASPLFQTLADEALVREALGNSEFTIECTLAPLPPTRVEQAYGAAEDAFSAWFLIVLSFPFISGAFATFIVTERENKGKHLQTVAGVKPFAYWFSSFLWDTINYQFPFWITVLLFFAFGVDVFTTTERGVIGGIITVLALFGPAAAGYAYCWTFAFKSPSMVFLFLVITGFLIGMGGPLTIFILYIIGEDKENPKPNLVNVANILTWCLRPLPPFCLGQGIYAAINIEFYEFINAKDLTVWDSDILLVEVIFLAAEAVVYLGLATLMDIASANPRFMQRFKSLTACLQICNKKEEVDITVALPDDSDVIAEQERVLSGGANDDLIVVSEMTKIYDNGKKAVNNFSLGIAPGECFGLLGINGAGKTSLMGMLTAEFPPTFGDASLAGYSVVSQPEMTRRLVGYCPQFDAHFANMTGREHVELYAAIKGIPKEFVREAAADKLRQVGLSEEDSDRLSAGYSGGMKRRLSLACAMIGQPRIVFLDEASTGVDPVARREIWQLVSDMVSSGEGDEGTSVILTTHSMEECEALCPRIGIMANGRLRCLGSAQHLKNKFGQGFQIEMKVKLIDHADQDYIDVASKLSQFKGVENTDVESADGVVMFNLEEVKLALVELTGDNYLADIVSESNPAGYNIFKNASAGVCALDELAAFCTTELRMRNLETFVGSNFEEAVLRERQDTKSRYEVSSKNIGISGIFARIEENKEELRLADYGVSQTSLEQVFNMHAAEAEKLKEGRNDG